MRAEVSVDRLPIATTPVGIQTTAPVPDESGSGPGTPAAVWRRLRVVVRPWTLVLVASVVGHLLPLSWVTSGPSFCPFKVATGLPCPGCGLTRSSVALLHGDLGTSLYYHPLGVAMIASAVVVGLIDLVVWWRGRRPDAEPLPPSWIMERIFATPAPWIGIAALTIVWVVRLPLYLLGAWTF